jgi:hypothetical protein
MDQVKKFLRIVVAQRFWILCVIAALVPMIAYFVGSGKIAAETSAKTAEIDGANKGVDPYKSGRKPNPDWKSLTDGQTTKLTGEINEAWKELYSRQAPLLRWPLDRVEEKFRAWGRRHPEATEASPDEVYDLIQDYVNFHPEYVTSVYKSFRPFDFMEGTGIVVSPDEKGLLRPQSFEISKAPKLADIWKEQEKMWVSQAILAVVDQVNKQAKTWDEAGIKQIVRLEVASDAALDPKSQTEGLTLVDAPNIPAPGETEEVAAEEGGAMTSAGYGAPDMGMGGGRMGRDMDMMGMPGSMMGGGMSGGGGGSSTAPDVVKFLAPPEGVENPPYFIVPIMLTTLIEQDKVADLLVELERSPMAIQVMALELAKPSIKVVKPEKGDTSMLAYGGMTGMMGGMPGGMMGGRRDMDMMGSMPGGMMGGMPGGMMGGMGPGMGGMPGMDMGMGMGMGGMGEVRKGTDVRSKDRRADRKKAEEALTKRARISLQDPYYNVVELTVYGQARFYTPPPKPEPTESSGDAATPAENADAASAEPKAENGATAPEPAKTDETPKSDAPGAEEPKAAEPAKADEPNAAEPKAR